MPAIPASDRPKPPTGLTDIPGIRVGHYTDPRRPTGCTVVLLERGEVAGVDVRGSAPGTRETDLLNPVNTVNQVHAIVLAGGSAFGLDAASGAVQYLNEKNIGLATGAARVPIVPAAIIYDLAIGDSSIRPDKEAGYRACQAASDGPVSEGSLGAGAGATVGKLLGTDRAMKGGLGSAAVRVGDLVVAALAVVNCVGDVVDPLNGRILAGARGDEPGTFINLSAWLQNHPLQTALRPVENTTLGVVATNGSFTKPEVTRIAQMSHDGLARAVRPSHLPWDGDTIFAIATGAVSDAGLTQVGALAAEMTAQAIVRAVRQARGLPGFPSHSEYL